MPLFYTYVLIDPRTRQVFYVGKGTGKRIYAHKNSNNRLVRQRVRQIRSQGYKVIYEKLIESEDEKLCAALERFFIASIGRENLCNLRRGGETRPLPTPESKEKNRAAHLGKKFGPRPQEIIDKIAQANRGKKRNDFSKMKMSASAKLRVQRDPDRLAISREKGLRILKEKYRKDPEFKAHMRAQRQNRVWVTHSVDGSRRIPKEKLPIYLALGFQLGRGSYVSPLKGHK